MISDFHFLRPLWLIALLFPPALLWLSSRSGDIRNRWKTMIAPHLLESLIVEPGRGRRRIPVGTLAFVIALAVLGAAGPTWQREAPPFVADNASLVIVVNLSSTMDAIDISPSRIERVKLKIHDVLNARSGARTAVIAYAGSAHLVVPLTEDAELIETYTDALATRIMPKPGQDTVAALRLADDLLKGDGTDGTILLLTDGVEAGAASRAPDLSNPVVVLGVGTKEGGVVKTPDGGFLGGSGGARLIAKLDADALKNFADSINADVATTTDDDSDVRWAVQRIRTNFAEQKSSEGDRWHNLGWWLVIPAALLFCLSFRRGWLVRVAAVVLAVQSLGLPRAQAADFIDVWLTPDQQGRLLYQRGDYAAAAGEFRNPMWRGSALYGAGRYEDALDAFASVDSPESWYNQGNVLLHLGRFEDAVSAYDKALAGRADWPDAQENREIAERLVKQEKDKEQEQQQDPNEKPDQVQFDDKGKKGKAGEVMAAEQTSDMWMKNIRVSPADLLARKFSIEAGEARK
jgi:Ca-activated chloride channel homolog